MTKITRASQDEGEAEYEEAFEEGFAKETEDVGIIKVLNKYLTKVDKMVGDVEEAMNS